MKKFIKKKNIVFITLFAIVGFIFMQVPVNELVGSGAKFSLFDSFALISGAFIGSIPGVIAVFLMQFLNFLWHGAEVTDAGAIIRFFPILLAVLYFARKGRSNFIVPVLAIIAFVANPIGREVWFFSLFWTIPIIAYFLRDRFLLARSLGATFSAHSVGGALWVWFVPLPAEIWVSLIPVVIIERLLFALGIAVSFVVVNNFLCALERKDILKLGFKIEPKYLLSSLRRDYQIKEI
jgi:riboflavin transporter FmnP